MSWETVIGLEIHVQLAAGTKIFSAASAKYCTHPNSQVKEVDAGLPGALPVLNRRAVECAMRLGIALSATINTRSEFARKHYFYPDLPKGYQISQYEYPLISGGHLCIGDDRKIGITRAHLEEDAGKLVHEGQTAQSSVDLNRAGVPLLEVVSEPDLRTVDEAVTYATLLHQLVQWLEVCDGNMQEGSFRIDANISMRRPGEGLGTRSEIKNLNSFRFLHQALTYEQQRQIEVLSEGGRVQQETRLFDTASGQTRSMRSKEDAQDYRYFPDPDLPLLIIDEAWIARVKDTMPELPEAKRDRLRREYGLSAYDAAVITATRPLAMYYERTVSVGQGDGWAKLCANWLCGDLAALLNEHGERDAASHISADRFAGLMRCIQGEVISGKIAKQVLREMWQSPDDATTIIERQGLRQISDESALEKLAADSIAAFPKQAAQYRAGKDKLLGFFVGQLMKATKGRANPDSANAIMRRLLDD